MGCTSSIPDDHGSNTMTTCPTNEQFPRLDEHQKKLLKDTWEIFKPKKVAIGRRMFVNLFQIYPEMQDLFPEFRGAGSVECIAETKFLNGHSKRLMTALENAVCSLGDNCSYQGYVEELGRRHKNRKLKQKYLERMRAALISTFQELYPELWSSELEGAWYELFQWMSAMMLQGLHSN